MRENEYKRNIIIAILCDIGSLFILGYVLSAIAYGLFNENYKKNLDDSQKRKVSIIGKTISSFFFFMSCSYHGQSYDTTLEERMIISAIVGALFATICFFILKSKDKKMIAASQSETTFCTNCGAKVEANDTECSKCGALFIEEKQAKNSKEDNIKHPKEKESKDKNLGIVCDNCGAPVKVSDKKCPKCGESFEEEHQETGKNHKKNSNKKENKTTKSVKNEKKDMNKKYTDLKQLKELLDDNILTKEEFEKEKKKILK